MLFLKELSTHVTNYQHELSTWYMWIASRAILISFGEKNNWTFQNKLNFKLFDETACTGLAIFRKYIYTYHIIPHCRETDCYKNLTKVNINGPICGSLGVKLCLNVYEQFSSAWYSFFSKMEMFWLFDPLFAPYTIQNWGINNYFCQICMYICNFLAKNIHFFLKMGTHSCIFKKYIETLPVLFRFFCENSISKSFFFWVYWKRLHTWYSDNWPSTIDRQHFTVDNWLPDSWSL